MASDSPRFAALLLMGGCGSRFVSELPKQFHRLAGKAVYLHTLELFLQSPTITTIVLVCHADWVQRVKEEVGGYPNVEVIPGGNTRQESSYLGLLYLKDGYDYVVIHDAVRPLLSKEILDKHCTSVLEAKALNTCIPSTDTIVYSEDHLTVTSIPKRSLYLRGQTPQTFKLDLILKAHLKAILEGAQNQSDDCQLALRAGYPISIIEGSEENIKITTPLDLILAEQLLQRRFFNCSSEDSCLKGQSIAVVGSSGGIGQAICRALKNKGAHVLALAPSSSTYPIDLRDPSSIQHTMAKIREDIGELDGLINTAGKLVKASIEDISKDAMETMVAVNFTGLVYCCKWAPMKKGGHIINVSSSSFSKGRKDYALYSASKAAVVNFTEALAEERPDLHVNVIIPERTHTKLRLLNFPYEDPATLLSPEEVAKRAISLLSSDQLTGARFFIKKQLSY